jgi:hypothetical protein
LHDEGQQVARAWPAWPEVPEEPYCRTTQQEAPEEPKVKDEAGDQPQVTYRLDQF